MQALAQALVVRKCTSTCWGGKTNNEHGRSLHHEDLRSCSPILKICMGFTHPEDLHGFYSPGWHTWTFTNSEDLCGLSLILKTCMGFPHPEDLHGFLLTWLTYMDFHSFRRLVWAFPHPEDLYGLHSSEDLYGLHSSWKLTWVFNHPEDLLGILLEHGYLINFKMLLELR